LQHFLTCVIILLLYQTAQARNVQPIPKTFQFVNGILDLQKEMFLSNAKQPKENVQEEYSGGDEQ
jgi:hypothetical protein